MSARAVSPHSATRRPPLRITPAGPPRALTGPTISLQGPELVPFDEADIAPVRIVEAARPGALLRHGEVDGGLQLCGVEAGFGRGNAGPSRRTGDIGILGVRKGGHRAHLIEDYVIEHTLSRDAVPRAPPSS